MLVNGNIHKLSTPTAVLGSADDIQHRPSSLSTGNTSYFPRSISQHQSVFTTPGFDTELLITQYVAYILSANCCLVLCVKLHVLQASDDAEKQQKVNQSVKAICETKCRNYHHHNHNHTLKSAAFSL